MTLSYIFPFFQKRNADNMIISTVRKLLIFFQTRRIIDLVKVILSRERRVEFRSGYGFNGTIDEDSI